MNIHTFSDAVRSKRTSLAHDLDVDDDEDDVQQKRMERPVEGEEEESAEKVMVI